MPRYRDPEKAKGDLAEGATLFPAPPLEAIPFRSYRFDEELQRQRDLQFNRFYSPRAPAVRAGFHHRSLKRGMTDA